VAARFKTFVQILMAVLALGISNPQPACAAAGTSAGDGKHLLLHGKPGLQMPSRACPGKQSCAFSPVQAFDKQMPARMAALRHPSRRHPLFSIAPARVKYFVLVPMAHRLGIERLIAI
jgi:hypothetical protein